MKRKDKYYKIINNRNRHSFNIGDKVIIINTVKYRSSTVPGEYYCECANHDGSIPEGGNCVLINDMKRIFSNINNNHD